MGNRKKQIFKENIEIPDIVQRKADEAFEIIRKERIELMERKKFLKLGGIMTNKKKKTALGICVCAALSLVIGGYGLFGKNGTGSVAPVWPFGNEEAFQTAQDLFTIKVYAASASDDSENGYVTLEDGKGVPLSLGEKDIGYVLCEGEDGTVSYCVGTHFFCEGEDIESITYSINEGAFQIVEPKDFTIVKAGEKYEGALNTGLIGGIDDETTGDDLSVTNNYKSFTVSYDNQMNERTWINICGVTNENWDDLFGKDKNLEDRVAGIEKLVDNVVITCTVQHADGSVGESQITIGGGTVKPEGTGIPEKAQPYETFVFRLQ